MIPVTYAKSRESCLFVYKENFPKIHAFFFKMRNEHHKIHFVLKIEQRMKSKIQQEWHHIFLKSKIQLEWHHILNFCHE